MASFASNIWHFLCKYELMHTTNNMQLAISCYHVPKKQALNMTTMVMVADFLSILPSWYCKAANIQSSIDFHRIL
jgi:hypothetical protein